jgi:NAD+ synthase/NAD+ synthase (glutamine-hydrolysing)
LTICEDVWNDKQFWQRPRYQRDPVEELAAQGIDVLINISASPYHQGKRKLRREMIQAIARRQKVPVVMVNQVGGNDQLVFDGSSFVVGPDGRVCACAKSFEEDLVLYDLATGEGDQHETHPDECEAIYDALVLGTRDYFRKCGFKKAILGLSGGIDSSLTAVIAVDAVGVENVIGIAMPGPHSSEGSVTDARQLAEKLGVRFEIIGINDAYDAFIKTLEPVFRGLPSDTTEENLQARLRGNTVMALSNKFGALVLTTGNKSELAVGYCTLYGDMVGGLAVISDVPKTLVYQLSRVANRRHAGAIPETVFTKPPSAELRPDQKDTDSLPEYDVLDPILKRYVEDYEEPAVIAAELNVPIELVRDVTSMVERNEYKRKQAAPGIRVTSKAFGIGRRFPIAQRFSR